MYNMCIGFWSMDNFLLHTHTHTHFLFFHTHIQNLPSHTLFFQFLLPLFFLPPHIHIGIGVCFYYKIIFVKHQRKKMFFACLFSCSVSISLLSPPSAFITFFLLFKFPAIFSGHCARGGRAWNKNFSSTEIFRLGCPVRACQLPPSCFSPPPSPILFSRVSQSIRGW